MPFQGSRKELIQCYKSTRRDTTDICAPLEIEDYVTQPISEVSPPKWHLGHTAWFFEELILVAFLPGYLRYNDGYRLLFNSYYKMAGKHWAQGERGNLSRPTVAEVLAYRNHVDENFANRSNLFHPTRADLSVGQVWYWSRSHYSPYPRYQAYQGMLEEYNGKFMCNQFVLKGGCAVTPAGHYRHTYRNFYQPHQRWMFSGIRLARDVS
jgi:hypothetical protein